MTESKKAWMEPELIVLVRSKPEEAVLIACKGDGGPPSALDFYSNCYNFDGDPCPDTCITIAGS